MQPDAETGLAPTQLGEVPVTEAHQAWALDPDMPEPDRRSSRLVAAAVGAALLLLVGAGGLAVWQLEEPAPVEPVIVAVTPEPAVPVAAPEPPPEPVAPPTTVTVTAAPTVAPTAVPKTPQVSAELDRRFLAALRAKGWAIWDEGAVIWRARQVCAQFQQHASMNQIMAGIAADAAAEGHPNPYLTAEQLAYTALEVYPACERR